MTTTRTTLADLVSADDLAALVATRQRLHANEVNEAEE